CTRLGGSYYYLRGSFDYW
nr:immunoglobulin heavy chain junction region [Macaca mulatta]MOX91981.1 immunoglobulin heavy chain junction region [Macaca mulatta]MOX92057.1 immunoglobulin heavy chain junction region [Macaca mulatta]MOX92093.1 immunoglobulin heavy chain junction region [Macaca mulatta]MOX92177.1 immunoglobulin heavy chain junction region [Macaca mulatta]